MRMRFYTWRNAQQHINLLAFVGSKGVQQMQLVEIVDDEAADVGIKRHVDFIRRFVVAVEMNALCREAGFQRRVQFAVGNDVERQSFLLRDASTLP